MNGRGIVSLLLGITLAACGGGAGQGAPEPPRPEVVDTPVEVLEQVTAAHREAPATLTFTQVNTVTLSSGNLTQRQRVIVQAPGRMRVDNLPLSTQTGAIYLNGRAISFANGRRAGAANERNPFLLLGFSVFRQPAQASREALESLGIAMNVMREATWNGTPVWVIGAPPGDSTTNQLWVDRVRWLPVRLIQSERRGGRTLVSDTRFGGHADPYPSMPRTIEVHRDGRRALRGEIREVRTGIAVPPATFDTTALRPVQP